MFAKKKALVSMDFELESTDSCYQWQLENSLAFVYKEIYKEMKLVVKEVEEKVVEDKED